MGLHVRQSHRASRSPSRSTARRVRQPRTGSASRPTRHGAIAWGQAQSSGCSSPEAWAAIAAFWSGDSMSPEGQPAVPPAPHLAGTAAAGAVALASVRGEVTRRDARLHRFLESGRDIATGGPGRLPAETA